MKVIEDLIRESKEQHDIGCSDDANLQHFKYMLAGYRHYIVNRFLDGPFHPGSARDMSWKEGQSMALKDLMEFETE